MLWGQRESVEAELRVIEGMRVACVCVPMCVPMCVLSQIRGYHVVRRPLLYLVPLGSKSSSLKSCSSFSSQGEDCELHMKSTPW